MAIIIIGIIILVAGMLILKQKEEFNKLGKGIRAFGIVLIIIGAFNACVKQIDAGQIGVTSLFGKISNEVLTSGLSFVNPLVDVYTVDIKTLNYTMSGVHNEGEKEGDDAIRVLTADGLEVTIDLTVLYRVVGTEAPRLIKETGLDYKDKIVRPLTRTKIRDNAVSSDFTVSDSILSYALLDETTNHPVSNNGYRPSTNNQTFSTCMMISDPNASRIGVNGVYFSASTAATSGVALTGEEIALNLYRWDDPFVDLNDAALAFTALTSVASGFYYFPGDLQGETVTYSLDVVLKEIKDSIKEVSQKFDKIDERFDRLDNRLTKLEIGQADIKGDIKVLDGKIEGIDNRLKSVEGTQKNQVWTLIILLGSAIITAAWKVFFSSNI